MVLSRGDFGVSTPIPACLLRVTLFVLFLEFTFCSQESDVDPPDPLIGQPTTNQDSESLPTVLVLPKVLPSVYSYFAASTSLNGDSTKVLTLKTIESQFVPGMGAANSMFKWVIIGKSGLLHEIPRTDFLLPHDALESTFLSDISTAGLEYHSESITSASFGCSPDHIMYIKDNETGSRLVTNQLKLEFGVGMSCNFGGSYIILVKHADIWCTAVTKPALAVPSQLPGLIVTPFSFPMSEIPKIALTPTSNTSATMLPQPQLPTAPQTKFQINNYVTAYHLNFLGNYATVNIDPPQTDKSKPANSLANSEQFSGTQMQNFDNKQVMNSISQSPQTLNSHSQIQQKLNSPSQIQQTLNLLSQITHTLNSSSKIPQTLNSPSQIPHTLNSYSQSPRMSNSYSQSPRMSNSYSQSPHTLNSNSQSPRILNSYSQSPRMPNSYNQSTRMPNSYSQSTRMPNSHSPGTSRSSTHHADSNLLYDAPADWDRHMVNRLNCWVNRQGNCKNFRATTIYELDENKRRKYENPPANWWKCPTCRTNMNMACSRKCICGMPIPAKRGDRYASRGPQTRGGPQDDRLAGRPTAIMKRPGGVAKA
eukprot:160383_1